MPTPTRKQRIKDMRAFSACLQGYLKMDGCHRLHELTQLIKTNERNHRKPGYGSGYGPTYQESVPTAVDYFVIRTISYAMQLFDESTGRVPRVAWRSLNIRTDYLIAMGIVAQHGSKLEANERYNAEALRSMTDLVDYANDIAGNH